MTLTFNPDKYSELLTKYQPKNIINETDNEKALSIVEELMHRKNCTPEENELYELLIILIEKFEQEFYHPGSSSTPHSLLLFLMDQQGVKAENLVDLLGTQQVVNELIDGKIKINEEQAKALGDLFKVDASLFI